MTERELFVAALHLDEAARVAFLDLACDDRSSRSRVESLLLEHDRWAAFSNRRRRAEVEPAADLDTTTDLPGELLGTVIAGKYKLMELIGEGGMGSVWMARQTEPVKRFVAVKLIKAGMDSKAVLARFEAERQALAVMDHPNIARILDGGVTEASPVACRTLLRHGAGQGGADHGVLRRPQTDARGSGWNCSCRSARRSSTPTRRASSTATSSPPTC